METDSKIARLERFIALAEQKLDAALLRQASDPMGHHWIAASYIKDQLSRANCIYERLAPRCDKCRMWTRLPGLVYCEVCWETEQHKAP